MGIQTFSTEFHHQVEDFLGADLVKMFIHGEWVESADRATFQTRDPGSGSVLTNVAEGKAADIDRAVSAARDAFARSEWSRLPANDRAVFLHRLADLVDEHQQIIAQLESLDVGKPLSQARMDVGTVSETLRWYADLSVHTRLKEAIAVSGHEAYQARFPYGVVGLILPWNFPILLVGWNISPALAAGNTVVIKPAEDTPLSTLYLCKLVQEAGIPDGVVNVVPGYGETAGAALAEHPGINRMAFTGSPEVGKRIAEACARNLVPTKLELGGKGAAVVFEDVDVKSVAEKLVGALTLNTGQVCCTATRWILHEKIADDLISETRDMLKEIEIGHGLDATTQMGPAVSEKQRRRILGYIERGIEEGAETVLEGGIARVDAFPEGFFVKPAILTGNAENVCAREEIFGPVTFGLNFRDEEEAIQLVNSNPYGLANSVWTSDLDRAHRVAEALVAGNSWINAHNVFVHGVPYGGVNLSGLGGGVLGPDTFFDYLRPQSIVRPLG